MRRSSAPSQQSNKKPRFLFPSKSSNVSTGKDEAAEVTVPDIFRILDEATSVEQTPQEQHKKATPLAALQFEYDSSHVQKNSDEAAPSMEDQKKVQNGNRYFSVMWCKMSSRKHKIWEGDAFLKVDGQNVTLTDTEGKLLGRGSGLKTQQLQSLEDGYVLSVGGKQCQIQNEISQQEYMASCQKQDKDCESAVPVIRHAKKPSFLCNKYRKPLNPVTNINSLVMPKPSNSHQWQHNAKNLPIKEVIVDHFLSRHLRPHQREGVTFLYQCIMGMKDFQGFGAILADEMGLGKTLQCITLIWTVLKQGPYGGQPLAKRVLIVTPGSLVKNWEQEFGKWLGFGKLPVFCVNGKRKVQDYLRSGLQPVLILSYEMFLRHSESLFKLHFDLLICDEGHRLKNANIRTTNALSELGISRRILLTGTPIQNDLQELYSLIDFCNPGLLGSMVEFRTCFENPIVQGLQQENDDDYDLKEKMNVKEAEEQRDKLNRLTSQCMLRRTHQAIQDLLPPKVEHVLVCRGSPLQHRLYNQVISSEVLYIQEAYSGTDGGPGGKHLRCITWLKKLCNHPSLLLNSLNKCQPESKAIRETLSMFPSSYSSSKGCDVGFDPKLVSDSGKLLVLSHLLSALREGKPTEKVVLVSGHTQTLNILEGLCKSRSYPFLRLDGSTPVEKRHSILKEFNASSSTVFVFLLSSRAGGVGLSLVGASRIVLFDLDWNPATDLQAIARVWRHGQKRVVHAYRFITAGSIEETIFQRQVCKQTLSDTVLDSRNVSPESFSSQDLKELLYPMRMESNTHDLLDCKCLVEDENLLDTANSCSLQEETDDQRRSCQLGTLHKSSTREESEMCNLLHWNHIPQKKIKQEVQDSYLKDTCENLTFVFERKVVTGYTDLPET